MSTASSNPNAASVSGTMEPVNIDELDTFELTSSTTDVGNWVAGWFAYGGQGADGSAALYFSIPPGKRLGQHIDMTEETLYILSGSGDMLLDEGARPVRPGDLVVVKQGVLHDLRNTGSEDVRVVAYFNGPKAEMHWTKEVWEPGHLTVTGTPNR